MQRVKGQASRREPAARRPLEAERFRVLIAGGGVAALEALLALRELAGHRPRITLIAPEPEFRYRPLSVTEPFGLGVARRLDLAEAALEQRAYFRRDALAEVEPDSRTVRTVSGHELAYDALLIAIGARPVEAIPGALTFRGATDAEIFRELLGEIERGERHRVAFAVPVEASWPLGLYELALLTSDRLRDRLRQRGLPDVRLQIVTPEPRPLALFGRRASQAVAELLGRAGIEIRLGSTAVRFADGRLTLTGGRALACDRVVSLPALDVPPIPGIPQGHRGYIPIDRFGGVLGLNRVYAAGDATWFPIKQGGIAAQQADSAASAIAALAGAGVDPQPFRPVLRGALLTGWGPRYLRARPEGDRIGDSAAAKSVLWWPPAKVAGRLLAPYLAAKAGQRVPADRPLCDLEAPDGDDAGDLDSGHADVTELALRSADANARWRDFRGALRWLEVAEDLELYLPPSYEAKRASWQELARTGPNPA